MATADTDEIDQANDDLAVLEDPVEAVEGSTDAAEVGEVADPVEDAGEVVVTMGDEPPPAEEEDTARAPQWLKDLRKSNREKDRVIREREAEIARLKGSTAQPDAVVLGPKPTLATCDYDEDKYERDLDAWHAAKRADDERKSAKRLAADDKRAPAPKRR